jgi:hypothetical protein
LLAWGNAVANNYDGTVTPVWGTHRVPGIFEPYLRVATRAGGSGINSRIEVPEDSETVKVNDMEYNIGAAAFIDPDNESFYVPVRFISTILSVDSPDTFDWNDVDGPVRWNNDDKAVTIHAGNRVVRFEIGSEYLTVNGTPIKMAAVNGSGVPVTAKIVDTSVGERAYIPFRALGEALDVPVAWDADTRTAIYNP